MKRWGRFILLAVLLIIVLACYLTLSGKHSPERQATGDTAALENKVIRKRRIAAITALLEHFKRAQYIQDFTITKERGGKIDGVTITVPPRQNAIEG